MSWRLFHRLPLLIMACLASSTAQAAVIEVDLQQAMQAGGEVQFIVQFADQLDLSSFPGKGRGKGVQLASMIWALRNQADASQADAVELLKGRGARRLIKLWSINALAATAGPDVVQALAALPGVRNIKLDGTLSAPSAQPAAAAAPEWNLNTIRATELWNAGYDGSGTVVANMDTGVDADHPDLALSWRDGANSWFDPNGEHSTPYDTTGHGTQTMSLMVGGDAGGSSIGVSPGAQWIAVKIFNDAGVASLSGIHQGFQWLLDPDGNPATNDVPDVVNNSWGFPELVGQCYTEFDSDISVLKAAGIAVVFSGGNQGTLGSVSPGDNPESFAVGSVDASLNIASTSSRGPSACDGSFFPEVVAPGVSVRTADLTFGGVFPNSYASVSGTSFAAPHVAGTMALLRQASPATTVTELEQALADSALDLGLAGPDDEYGYGLIDAVAANDVLASAPGSVCTDFDSDGFFAEAGCGSEVDCSDFDAAINPAACDIKRDGIDQNCDGRDRRRGQACPATGGEPVIPAEGKRRTCSDGIDNDLDGLIDCLDPGCSNNKSCAVR
ncbi:MAG: S8 family serine peptidase [Gammaproteobacteria bacterium]|nr:S8 family serine peptidase [Gammaproteobacteria bacterium]MCW8923267.1 S8 family serine peptidase [Gammaproteobacteria bacterium]